MKHFMIFLLLWLRINPADSFACSYSLGPEGYRIGLFLPYTAYKPWNSVLNYDFNSSFDPDLSMATEHDRNINCLEWKKFCGKTVSIKDIYFVLYQVSPAYFLDLSQKEISTAKPESKNSFIKWLKKKENKEVLAYMNFAKYCENRSMQRMDPWDEDMLEFDTEYMKYYSEGYKSMQSTTSTFLKQRWAFQFNRIHAYGAAYEDTIHAALKTGSEVYESKLLYGWTCAYMAKLCSAAESNIYLTKAFEFCADKRHYAVKYFLSRALNESIRAAKDNSTKAMLYALDALGKKETALSHIRKIIELDPSCEALEPVIMREVQKFENIMLTKKITGFYPPNENDYWGCLSTYFAESKKELYSGLRNEINAVVRNHSIKEKQYLQYGNDLLQLLETKLLRQKKSNQGFYSLAAAHLAMCLEKNKEATTYLKHAARYIKKKNPLYINLEIAQALAGLQPETKITSANENKFYKILNQLDTLNGYDVVNLKEQFIISLCHAYEKKGEFYKSVLLLPKLSGLYKAIPSSGWSMGDYTNSFVRYYTNAGRAQDAESMMNFLNRQQHNNFERLMLKSFHKDSANYDLLMDWTGTLFLREERYAEALNAFKKVDKDYWKLRKRDDYDYDFNYKDVTIYIPSWYSNYMDANPFYARVGNNHGSGYADTVLYNKKTFTEKWISLVNKSRSLNPKDRDHALLQLANARYSMTWYGNSWILWRNEWSSSEPQVWPGFDEAYYGCSKAKESYLQLFKTTTNKEIKARCCVMIALCEKNEAYFKHGHKENYKYKGGPYLKLFQEKFRSSQTYQDLVSSCLGEEEFIANMKRN